MRRRPIKRLVLELGGHAPFLVFDDADLDKAVDWRSRRNSRHPARTASPPTASTSQRGRLRRIRRGLRRAVAALRVGAGFEDDVEIGPLMHERAVAKVEAACRGCRRRGARLLAGGKSPRRPGRSSTSRRCSPMSTDDALIMHEETFGPVAAVVVFDTEEEVVAPGQRHRIWARRLPRHRRLPARSPAWRGRSNTAWWRSTGSRSPARPIPFGGVKQSGIGREGSRHGIEAFTELKYVCLDVA